MNVYPYLFVIHVFHFTAIYTLNTHPLNMQRREALSPTDKETRQNTLNSMVYMSQAHLIKHGFIMEVLHYTVWRSQSGCSFPFCFSFFPFFFLSFLVSMSRICRISHFKVLKPIVLVRLSHITFHTGKKRREQGTASQRLLPHRLDRKTAHCDKGRKDESTRGVDGGVGV